MQRDATTRIGRRRMLGLALATGGFFLVVIGFAASPDHLGLGDHIGVLWAMVAGFLVRFGGDAYRIHEDRSKTRAFGPVIVVVATGAVVALLGMVLIWTLSPILIPTKLTAGALVIAEAGLLLGGVAAYLWVPGSNKERRAGAFSFAVAGGILAEVGLIRYLPVSPATADIAFWILILTAIWGFWALARQIRRRAGSARSLGGEP